MNRASLSALILVAFGALCTSAAARPHHKQHPHKSEHPGRGPSAAKPGSPPAAPAPLPIRIRDPKSPKGDAARPDPDRQPAQPGGVLKRPRRKNQLKKPPAPH